MKSKMALYVTHNAGPGTMVLDLFAGDNAQKAPLNVVHFVNNLVKLALITS